MSWRNSGRLPRNQCPGGVGGRRCAAKVMISSRNQSTHSGGWGKQRIGAAANVLFVSAQQKAQGLQPLGLGIDYRWSSNCARFESSRGANVMLVSQNHFIQIGR